MCSRHIETYQQGTTWTATTTAPTWPMLRTGGTEVEALANLCDVLYQELEGKTEYQEWEP